jgi:hypothetical protein
MILTQTCAITADVDRLWDLLMEIPQVAQCIPGVESVEPVDADSYRGTLKIQVGPIRLSLNGTIVVEERDRGARRASMRAEASDKRVGGGVRARMTMTLIPGERDTTLSVSTDVAILGKLGEFGQPIIKKKADAMMQEFAGNLGKKLAER